MGSVLGAHVGICVAVVVVDIWCGIFRTFAAAVLVFVFAVDDKLLVQPLLEFSA